MSNLSSVETERALIGGILNNPQVIPDIDFFVKEQDFSSRENGTIFNCIKQLYQEKKEITVSSVTARVNSLGLRFKGGIDVEDYISSLSLFKINEKATREASQEILKLRTLRDLEQSASKVKELLYESKNKPLQEVITQVDGIMSSTINTFVLDDKPQLIFEDLEDEIRILGDNPKDATGLKTPFKNFDRLFGELRNGNVYAIASRPGQGKTTFLCEMGKGVAEINNVPVLYLDTEMTTPEIKLRMAAAETGVPLWYVETGNWNKNAELRKKMNDGLARINQKLKKLNFYHYHVGNKTIDEVLTVIRRWYWTCVGRGNRCLVIYDYLKLTGEKVGANWAEYQAIGEKTDKLKRISIEIDNPVFTAIQINRTGENTNKSSKEVTDDSSVIAQSDRVLWFVSFLAIYRRKTADEFILDSDKFGTHKMIDLKTRYQGKDAAGHQNLVERKHQDGSSTFEPNYVCFSTDNFKVEELGTLEDIVQAGGPLQVELTTEDPSERTF